MCKPSHMIPVNIRQYARTMAGSNQPLTENDLWDSDKEAIKRAIGRTSEPGVIGYGDYGQKPAEFSDWQGYGDGNGVGPITALIKSYTDPKFRMETTLGMANYTQDPIGNTVVADTYDFNAKPELVEQKIKEHGGKIPAALALSKGAGFEGLLNVLGNLYVAPDGQGTPVNINLGKIE